MNQYTEFAQEIVESHNAREAALQAIYPNAIDHIEFLGEIKQDGQTVRELVPNQKNPALMDVAEITRYAGKFAVIKRYHDQKRSRKSINWYYVGQETKRVEIGSYYARD